MKPAGNRVWPAPSPAPFPEGTGGGKYYTFLFSQLPVFSHLSLITLGSKASVIIPISQVRKQRLRKQKRCTRPRDFPAGMRMGGSWLLPQPSRLPSHLPVQLSHTTRINSKEASVNSRTQPLLLPPHHTPFQAGHSLEKGTDVWQAQEHWNQVHNFTCFFFCPFRIVFPSGHS